MRGTDESWTDFRLRIQNELTAVQLGMIPRETLMERKTMSTQPEPMLPAEAPMRHRVFATREGLVGEESASGYIIDRVVKFVALPSEKALKLFVRVTNPKTGLSTLAQVLEVGPWSERDDKYVFGPDRPLSEQGYKVNREGVVIAANALTGKTNDAGIDLGQAVWIALGMSDNGPVEWEFVS